MSNLDLDSSAVKSGKVLPQKVMDEIGSLFSPFLSDMTRHRFEIEVNRVEKLEYIEELSELEHDYIVYKCGVEATIKLYNVVKIGVVVQNPYVSLNHFIDEALRQEDFVSVDGRQLVVLRKQGIKVSKIGTPIVQNGSSRIEVPVEFVLFADVESDYFKHG